MVLVVAYFILVTILVVMKYHDIKKISSICWRLSLCVLIFPVVAPMSLSGFSKELSDRVVSELISGRPLYYYYDSFRWEMNIKNNGILTHLIQTSSRTFPKEASEKSRSYIGDFKYTASPSVNVVFILCESCWKNEKFFVGDFKPLLDIGMREVSIVSPGYGGNTANSEFEMYTGLSSRTVLSGVIFQEYADAFSKNSISIVSSLRDAGYETVALHNFFRKNWRRNDVLNKLGFSRFISLEDMISGTSATSIYPSDSILYEAALDVLNKINVANNRFFLSLITVSTHGPYLDEKYYESKLNVAIKDIASFIEGVKKKNPDTLFVVYGDHKPGLTDYFLENKVIKSLEDSQDIIGRVPAFILGKSKSDMDVIYKKLNGLPMYCFSSVLDGDLIKSGNPITKIMSQTVCNKMVEYHERLGKINQDLYWVSFFNDLDKGWVF